MGLGFAARGFTRVSWLRAFHLRRHLAGEHRNRAVQSANRTAGAELILLGVAIVLAYFEVTRMFFHSPGPAELAVVGALSGLCVTRAVIALVRNR